ncbi:MAG: hypothetical protein GY750_04235 [Lentisphaerae bacterium]|nr:hypothetical protein [Lentisphaerota bacterium]MCP4100620.1 hypothetical protein [Lentisphaerota bacterium]
MVSGIKINAEILQCLLRLLMIEIARDHKSMKSETPPAGIIKAKQLLDENMNRRFH